MSNHDLCIITVKKNMASVDFYVEHNGHVSYTGHNFSNASLQRAFLSKRAV